MGYINTGGDIIIIIIILVGIYKYWWGYNTILSMGFKLADLLILGVVYLTSVGKDTVLLYPPPLIFVNYIPTSIIILYPHQYL